MSLKNFNSLIDSIAWTEDYPKHGIRFADLSGVFGNPALSALVGTIAKALFIEKGQVVLGVPSRGCIWASIVAAATGIEAVYLSKEGSTPLPQSEPLVSAGTAYAQSRTTFNIRTRDVERLKAAHVVWVADDVCESGQTLSAIATALRARGCHDVRLLPLLTIDQPAGPTIAGEALYSVIEYDSCTRTCYPGRLIFGRHPRHLLTLRGNSAPSTRTLVYGPPSMVELIQAHVETHADCYVGDIQWDAFEGGMPNIVFAMPNCHDVVFIYDAAFMKTVQDGVVHALARNCHASMIVLIPFLPQGTMERVDAEGTLATAHTTLHSLCANMPMAGKGPVEVIIYDIHQTGTRFYCGDKVKYVPRQLLKTIVPESYNIIAFPDDGAAKRFKHLFSNKTLLVFSKSRKDGKRLLSLSDTIGCGEIAGGTIVIVDDLTRTGGTLMETAKILKSLGARSIAAAFVHVDFDPGKTIPFARCALFDAIYCTNSNPQKAAALVAAGSSNGLPVIVSSIFGDAPLHQQYSIHTALLSSTSESKVEALRQSYGVNYLFCGPVPSGVPDQPVGEQGPLGASNRSSFLKRLYPSDGFIVSYESAIDIQADAIEDRAYANFRLKRANTELEQVGRSKPISIPSKVVSDESICGWLDGSLGEHLQSRYNLPTKDAWIGHFSDGDRVDQLLRISFK